MKKIRNLVLGVLTLLLSGTVSALDLPIKNVNGKEYYYYAVTRGETVFSIANKIGVTRDDIIKYNPGAADGIRQGATIFLPVSEFKNIGNKEIAPAPTASKPFEYQVKRGETLFGLSHRFGVTPDAIIALNPAAKNGVKAGMTLIIPGVGNAKDVVATPAGKPIPEEPVRDMQLTPVNPPVYQVEQEDSRSSETTVEPLPIPEEPARDLQLTPVNPPVYVVNDIEVVSVDTVVDEDFSWDTNVGLMLPLHLSGSASALKSAQMSAEFMRGFMLGVRSLENSAKGVNIYVYDTEDKAETIAQIMANPEVANLDVVIGPQDVKSFDSVVGAINSDAMILNVFAAQDTSYLVNSNVVQCNVPQDVMLDKASDAMIGMFNGYTPVFLISKGGKSEKINFTDRLRAKYAEKSITPIDLTYQGMLTSLDLESLDSLQRYVFIPASGSLSEFNKFSRAIRHIREQAVDPTSIALIGYPDWTTFRGEALDNLHSLEAVIYSRFYADAESDEIKAFEKEFTDEYGSEILEQVPSQAMMGYDIARYLLSNLIDNEGGYDAISAKMFRGLQSSYQFSENEDNSATGAFNTTVYIITFQTGENVAIQVL